MTHIPEEFAGQRADVFLSSVLSGQSRSSIKKHIEAGNILIDRKPFKPSKIVSGGESLIIAIPPPEPPGVEAEEIDIEVVYEDGDLIVVDKPAGHGGSPGSGSDWRNPRQRPSPHVPGPSPGWEGRPVRE